jgi:hypothetical protein
LLPLKASWCTDAAPPLDDHRQEKMVLPVLQLVLAALACQPRPC